MNCTYRNPMLMATPTPIFSGFFIWRPMSSVHGIKARRKSEAAEYAGVTTVSVWIYRLDVVVANTYTLRKYCTAQSS